MFDHAKTLAEQRDELADEINDELESELREKFALLKTTFPEFWAFASQASYEYDDNGGYDKRITTEAEDLTINEEEGYETDEAPYLYAALSELLSEAYEVDRDVLYDCIESLDFSRDEAEPGEFGRLVSSVPEGEIWTWILKHQADPAGVIAELQPVALAARL